MDEQEIRAHLCEAGRRAVADGLVAGAGGNLSARTSDGAVLITPTGHRLDKLDPAELAVMDLDGHAHAGTPRPSSEAPMHLAAYRARPDARAVVHLHPPFATLLHAVGRTIRLITTDHAYYVRQIATVGYVPPGTTELAEATAERLSAANVVLMKHHGCVIVGDSMQAAYVRVLNLEEAAKATHRALLLGDDAIACPPEYLERVRGLEASADGYTYGQA